MPVAEATRTAEAASTAFVRGESTRLARESRSLAWLILRSHLHQPDPGASRSRGAAARPCPFCESAYLSSAFASPGNLRPSTAPPPHCFGRRRRFRAARSNSVTRILWPPRQFRPTTRSCRWWERRPLFPGVSKRGQPYLAQRGATPCPRRLCHDARPGSPGGPPGPSVQRRRPRLRRASSASSRPRRRRRSHRSSRTSLTTSVPVIDLPSPAGGTLATRPLRSWWPGCHGYAGLG